LKLDEALLLKDHIKIITDTFNDYAQAGLQLCKAMGNLGSAFQKFPEFQHDTTFQGVSKILFNLQEVFDRHYSSIQDMIDPLIQFAKVDIKLAEDNAKAAAQNYDIYQKLVEQYVWPPSSNSKKKISQADLQTRVQAAYWTAVRSDFDYTRSLTLLGHKRLIELAMTVFFRGWRFCHPHFQANPSSSPLLI
jgi:hypothetical protein